MGERGKRGHEEGVPLNSEKICMYIYIYEVTLKYARYSLSVHKQRTTQIPKASDGYGYKKKYTSFYIHIHIYI